MLHNEARELLVQGYEATHDAKGIAKAYSVSKWTVYRLAEQKRKTGSVALRTSQRGRKPVLTAEDKANIQHCMDESPDNNRRDTGEATSFCQLFNSGTGNSRHGLYAEKEITLRK